jgi:hypothetical protein
VGVEVMVRCKERHYAVKALRIHDNPKGVWEWFMYDAEGFYLERAYSHIRDNVMTSKDKEKIKRIFLSRKWGEYHLGEGYKWEVVEVTPRIVTVQEGWEEVE